MLKKILNFLFRDEGYSVESRIYHYDNEPYKGYILYSNWVCFGIPGCDIIEICHDKKSMQKELDIRNITSVSL